jgi:hypothetical protein
MEARTLKPRVASDLLIEDLDPRLRCTSCGARGQAQLIAVEAAERWAPCRSGADAYARSAPGQGRTRCLLDPPPTLHVVTCNRSDGSAEDFGREG